MKYNIYVPPYCADEVKELTTDNKLLPSYNLLTIGKESYIISGIIENSDEAYPMTSKLIHNLQIGKYCSIADEVFF